MQNVNGIKIETGAGGQKLHQSKMKILKKNGFLAVQDSSISDIVGRSVGLSVWAN